MPHTPGPWQIDGEAAECQARITADGEPIADVFGLDRGDDDGDEANANVALIAAAPDLLAACESALDVVDHRNNMRFMECAALLKSAIAKAKG